MKRISFSPKQFKRLLLCRSRGEPGGVKTFPSGCQSADARAVNHIESIASTLTRIYPRVSKPITVEGVANRKSKTENLC